MKSIIDDFKNGTARERLSITSDLFSIIGVSFVAIFAPLFASKAKLNVGEIAGISMITLLSFAGFSLALAFVLSAHSWLSHNLGTSLASRLIIVSMWCVFLAGFVYALAFIYYNIT